MTGVVGAVGAVGVVGVPPVTALPTVVAAPGRFKVPATPVPSNPSIPAWEEIFPRSAPVIFPNPFTPPVTDSPVPTASPYSVAPSLATEPVYCVAAFFAA